MVDAPLLVEDSHMESTSMEQYDGGVKVVVNGATAVFVDDNDVVNGEDMMLS
jgi:hypothetical protein